MTVFIFILNDIMNFYGKNRTTFDKMRSVSLRREIEAMHVLKYCFVKSGNDIFFFHMKLYDIQIIFVYTHSEIFNYIQKMALKIMPVRLKVRQS